MVPVDSLLANPVAQIALAVVALWAVSKLLTPKSSVEKLPLPSGAEWVWGHEKTVFMNEPGRAFRNWVRECGLTFRIKAAFGARDVLVLSDPGGISYILQKKIYDYHHSKVVRPRVARLLGKGLGWVEGEAEHKRMRHLVSPSLSHENVKAMSQEVRDAALQVIDNLAAEIQAQGDRTPINVLDWTGKATLNVVGRVAFLHDFEGGNSKDAQQILNARKRGVSPIVRYAGFLTLMLLRRFPILNDLPIPAIQSQGLVKMTIQSGVAHEMIRRNKDFITDEQKQRHKDLLSRLLIAQAEGKISRDELYEQISTFVVSGHETTTQTLGFTLWELSRHQDVQQRLREELDAFPREPTYDDFQSRLPYLDAVLRETLRMYPGLPYMERIAMKADVIPLREPVQLPNGDTITELPVFPGQTVLIPIIAIHRLDSVWKDGDTFRPERWLGDLPPNEQLCSGWANTLSFSDGPRNCIGMRLAIFQYKVILTYLLQRFKLKDAGANITLKVASSLQAWVEEKMEQGPRLPVILEAL
ncbi:hypothetical protein AcV7_005936 [Taiwanofungus camphoratus]|nr:hypothetical protein AcV7_005936 [Antrodia cinnamomea]